jgi:hypothetical protein
MISLLPWAITHKAGSDMPCPSSVGAAEPQPCQRLDGPVVGSGPRETLDQLGTADLRPVHLAL